jgi:hypothetical protein
VSVWWWQSARADGIGMWQTIKSFLIRQEKKEERKEIKKNKKKKQIAIDGCNSENIERRFAFSDEEKKVRTWP